MTGQNEGEWHILQPHSCGVQGLNSPTYYREGTEVLLAELKFPPEELAYGHTKIFIRSPRTVSVGLGILAGDNGVNPALIPPSPCSEPPRGSLGDITALIAAPSAAL